MDFQIPRIVHEEINEDRGVFVIEPLDRGFGYTFGNSLRRVLLSSLEGAGPPARPSWPFPRQRPPREYPELPGTSRHDHHDGTEQRR